MSKYKILSLVLTLGIVFTANAVPSSRNKFIHSLLPKIRQVNTTILQQRAQLQTLYNQFKQHQPLTTQEQEWLDNLAVKYKLNKFNMTNDTSWKKLLNRVDMIPVDLVLAQAANESAWGSSRFAKQGNNYFGQWCFTPGCGIVPKRRPKGAIYEIRKFLNPIDSINSYIYNLNTNNTYKSLRKLRAQLREQEKPLNGLILATGLSRYSQRGKAYVNSIQGIINKYNLASLRQNTQA